MGTNFAPFGANLYLYAYESSFVDKLLRNDVSLARKFRLSFRFIDDILFVNNPDVLQVLKEIYPVLDLTGTAGSTVEFLGMSITCPPCSSKFCIEPFARSHLFPFKVVSFPHVDSSIPKFVGHGVFVGQLHRYYKICSSSDSFQKWAVVLTKKMFRQGWPPGKLVTLFSRFVYYNVRRFNVRHRLFVKYFKSSLFG